MVISKFYVGLQAENVTEVLGGYLMYGVSFVQIKIHSLSISLFESKGGGVGKKKEKKKKEKTLPPLLSSSTLPSPLGRPVIQAIKFITIISVTS